MQRLVFEPLDLQTGEGEENDDEPLTPPNDNESEFEPITEADFVPASSLFQNPNTPWPGADSSTSPLGIVDRDPGAADASRRSYLNILRGSGLNNDTNTPPVYRFGLNSLALPNSTTINELSAQYAAFVNDKIVAFAQNIAGNRRKPDNYYLATGFENLTRLLREYVGEGGRAANTRAPPNRQTSQAPLENNPAAPAQQNVLDFGDSPEMSERFAHLATLAQQIEQADISSQTLDFLRANAHAEDRFNLALFEISTMPQNVDRIFYKAELRGPLRSALTEISKLNNNRPHDELFARILSDPNLSTQLEDFVCDIMNSRYRKQNQGHKTNYELRQDELSIQEAAWGFRNLKTPPPQPMRNSRKFSVRRYSTPYATATSAIPL